MALGGVVEAFELTSEFVPSLEEFLDGVPSTESVVPEYIPEVSASHFVSSFNWGFSYTDAGCSILPALHMELLLDDRYRSRPNVTSGRRQT